jgi:putative FmdB family regulatory protein
MPLYEYACDACGHRFERIQKFSDAPVDACPKCGGVVRKLVSSPAFHLKGSGWYATDYAKKTEPKGKSESGGEPSEKAEKGETAEKGSAEAKDAAKTGGSDASAKESSPKDTTAKESTTTKTS